MSYVALVGGVVGIGTAAYGASQTPDGITQHSVPVTGYNPRSDPLLSALALNSGVGVGTFDPNTYMQASPIQQLISQATASGTYNQRQMRFLNAAFASNPDLIRQAETLKGPERKAFLAENNISEKDFNAARRGLRIAEPIAQNAGYADVNALIGSNKAYLDKLPAIQAQFQPVADRMRAGTLASQDRIAGYLQNLPSLLTGEANPFVDELRREALHSAQKYGHNPYMGLEQARSQALMRALQLVQGEQAALGGQQQAALPIAQLSQSGAANAAGIGAGQAAMLGNALQSQQAAQANQANAWMNVGNQVAQMGLIGADMYANRGPATGPSGGGGYDQGGQATGSQDPRWANDF